MSAASNFLEAKLLDHVLGEGTRNYATGNVYLALFKNNALTNLEAGTLTDEISTSGTAYSRQNVTFANATTVAGTTTSTTSATVTWTTATADWGTVTALAIMDSATAGAGNVLFYGNLLTAKLIENGDTFQVSSSNLTVTLA
jgi:hypothetical protein